MIPIEGAIPFRLCRVSIYSRHSQQIRVGQHEGTVQQFQIVVHQVGKANAGDDSHGENFLHGVFNLDSAENLARLNVDRPDSASAFLFSFGDRDTTEDGRFTNLRQSHKGNRTAKSRPRVDPGTSVIG